MSKKKINHRHSKSLSHFDYLKEGNDEHTNSVGANFEKPFEDSSDFHESSNQSSRFSRKFSIGSFNHFASIKKRATMKKKLVEQPSLKDQEEVGELLEPPKSMIPKLSTADKIVDNIDKLIGRFDIYGTADYIQPNMTDKEKVIIFSQSAQSVIRNLGGKLFCKYLTAEKTQELVTALNANSEQICKLLDSEEEKQKAKLALAKTEATLKGFSLEVAMAAARTKLTKNDHDLFDSAIKQALLAVQKNCIEKSDYPQAVVAEIMVILTSPSKGTRFFSPKFLEFREIANQGNTSLKFKDGTFTKKDSNSFGLSDEDLAKISQAAEQSANKFIQKLDQKTEEVRCALSDASHQEERLPTAPDSHEAIALPEAVSTKNEETKETLLTILTLKDITRTTTVGEVNNSITDPTSTLRETDVNSHGHQCPNLFTRFTLLDNWDYFFETTPQLLGELMAQTVEVI